MGDAAFGVPMLLSQCPVCRSPLCTGLSKREGRTFPGALFLAVLLASAFQTFRNERYGQERFTTAPKPASAGVQAWCVGPPLLQVHSARKSLACPGAGSPRTQ